MSQDSKIEWTDHTFNPWWGCVKVSPACKHCYAETFAKRTGHKVWGDGPRRFFEDKHWAEPRKWNEAAKKAGKRAKVFCASMADVFELLPDDHPQKARMAQDRARLQWLMRDTRHLDWLLLTKRPENIRQLWPLRGNADFISNVWFGVTAENQEQWDIRVPILEGLARRDITTGAQKQIIFVSVEPMLGPVTVTTDEVDWVICGGESGAGARPMQEQWARDLRDQCKALGIPFMLKQLGGARDKRGGSLAILDNERHVEFPS